MINVTINNIQMEVEDGTTIIDAARTLGITIPTLCHLNMCEAKTKSKPVSCRVCLVEVEGRKPLLPACAAKMQDGMVVITNSKRAIDGRRAMIELILSNHPDDCLFCSKDKQCKLQTIAAYTGVNKKNYEGTKSNHAIDESCTSIRRDPNKCVMCKRCEAVCTKVQTVGVYSAVNRGFDAFVGTAQNTTIADTHCTYCGQCLNVCPTGALVEKSNIDDVYDVLSDKTKTVIVQTAPAVRVALGEEFGFYNGTLVTGKMVQALRKIGFDKVLDTNFGADLTIMEEANELIDRMQNNGALPIMTSCCPAWVKFMEHNFHENLDLLSSCKSPHQMFGAIAKTYYAEKMGIDPENLVVVSVMPCIAKKYESTRTLLKGEVDYVITTRELAKMIRTNGIQFHELEDSDFDKVMGESSGAGTIFGTTGGVIEAATRTAVSWLKGENIEKVDFEEIRGFEGIRTAKVNVDGLEIRIAAVNGLGNARKVMEMIQNGEADFHAIEVMACPGGCINGGGQPYHNHEDGFLAKRASGLYSTDKAKTVRLSHENPEIKALYEEYLGEPGGHKAHELLHTKFRARSRFSNIFLTK